MSYRVEIAERAADALDRLGTKTRIRVVRDLEGLAEEPRPNGCVKLKGESDLYRIRVGDYRVVYHIEDDILRVLVVRIGHRKDVYRR